MRICMKPTLKTPTFPCVMVAGMILVVTAGGCGDPTLLNPAFVNATQGTLFPVAPTPENGLVLIRGVNTTTESVSFLVTIERSTVVSDDVGGGASAYSETTELFTTPGAQSNEAGALFECTPSNPIARIGLGENLNRPATEPGLFVGGANDIIQGFGVPPNINPLSQEQNDFQCGDTIIFRALESNNAPGGFKVEAFVIPFETQGETVRDTFGVASDFLGERPSER